jgi:hypothetical protein
VGSFVPASAGAIAKVLAGAPVAEDRGEYLEGVNAVAVIVPGGVIFVAGFASRLPSARLHEVSRLLAELACE